MSQQDDSQQTLQAVLYMMGAVFMLSTMDAAFKQLVDHYSSLQVAFLRSALSSVFFAVWILLYKRQLFRTTHWRAHAARAVVGLLMLWSIGECFREMGLADAYAIFFTAPLLITVLSGPVMKEPAGPVRLTAAGVGFLGVLIVLKPGSEGLISYGSAMGLVAVVCYAFVAFMLRALGKSEASLTIAFWYTTGVALFSGVLLFGSWQEIRGEDIGWLVVLGVSGTFGQIMITSAFKRASAAVIAPLDYLHMIWAVLYGWLLWNELPGGRVWLGTGIIVTAGLLILWREQRLARAQRMSNIPRIPE